MTNIAETTTPTSSTAASLSSATGRAMLIGDREQQLRSELDGSRSAQFRRLLEECERAKGMELPQEHPLASITYFGPGSANLALAYRLTGQAAYLEELRRWLAPPLSFPHWGKANLPDHDLDAGWILHGLSLAYSWAGDALRPEEKQALEDKLLLQGQRMYEFAVEKEGGWWSSSYWQNHNWICYAGLATAGYALQEKYPEAKAWTERAKDNFGKVLDSLPDDGSNNEGVVYWRYGVPWIASYLDVLRDQEGLDWFNRGTYLKETFWYRLYQAAPDLERIVDHGDCHDRRSGHPLALYYKLAAEYRIPQAQWLANKVSTEFYWREAYESGVRPGVRPEAYQELLWFDPTVEPAGPETLPPSKYFEDLGLVVGRSSWDEQASLVSFKASPGGGHKAWDQSHRQRKENGWVTLNAGHHHPDSGSFVFLGNGSYLAIDEGYSSRKLTEHHNSILIDGNGFVNEDRYHVFEELAEEFTAEILTTTIKDGWTHAVSESSAMYDRDLGVTRVRRHLVMTPGGTLVIADDLAADQPRTWTWLLQTDNAPVALGDKRWRADAGHGVMPIAALDDNAASEIVETFVHANPTSSTPSLAISKKQHTLKRVSEPTTSARFVTVLESRRWDDTAPASIHYEVSDGGVRVEIERDGVTETVSLGFDGDAPTLGATAVVGEGFQGSTSTHR
ncbi:DUF4962 domain-containing protein [Salinibacterium sp. UTAS2018]|uniref:DUF4962 domain-containing protein n=1 Tax=Salinibacterium sp. UTAS2018 TaxID=2508880 RepID=UPI00100973DD|nr:DUF4962 domain-containing protein [Salinibacterium sp. UTAS2018]QAV70698.1 DUF4962 domain-containing protein [Salinibacterium sp. UTAS2018]